MWYATSNEVEFSLPIRTFPQIKEIFISLKCLELIDNKSFF